MKTLLGNFRPVAVGLLLLLAAAGVVKAQNPVPLINQPLEPDTAKPGAAGFTLTVNGTGFVPGAVVSWKGSTRATAFVSSSRLTASILAADIAKAGTVSVTVANPTPGGGTSNAVFFPISAPASAIAFSRTDYVLGAQPFFVSTADFNKDGKLDIAIANYGANSVSILLGNGDGTFQTRVDYPTCTGPVTPIVGDFNRDGKPDLAVVCFTSTISVLLGNGDGTFAAGLDYQTGSASSYGMAADLNSDGKLDIATTNQGSNTVSILLGNGDGTFQANVDYAVGSNPTEVAAADFNRDGKLDLVVSNYDSETVSILLGNGDGSFTTHVDYAAENGPGGVNVADVNRDGRVDLLVPNQLSGTVSVLLGNGDGTFRAAVNYPVSAGAVRAEVGDFNQDGKLDLAVVTYKPSLDILQGNGDGTFQAPVSFATGNNPWSAVAGDFNGDGHLDVAVPNSNDNSVSVLLQAPILSLSKSSLTFAAQVVGAVSAAQIVTLTNPSGLTLNISSIAITGSDANDFSQTNTCDSGLPPRGKCTITITFTPTHIGPRTASVTVTDNAAGSPQSITLSGTGVVSGPNATLSATSVTFATQLLGTTSPAQSITLTNWGTVTLTVSFTINGTDARDFAETNTCNGSVTPVATCTISLTFSPTGINTRSASLSIIDNVPGSPQTISLSGTGTVVELNPASLGFGVVPVGQSKSERTTLTNVGSATLSITGITKTGSSAFSEWNNCGSSVGAGKSCTITVTFKPGGTGFFHGTVSVSDDGGASPQQVGLSGCGNRCKLSSMPALRSALAATNKVSVPSPTGSIQVGTRVMNVIDPKRGNPFLPDGAKRELLVRFWYPASADQDCKLADYASPRVWSYFSELTGLLLPAVTTNSCLDAPVAEGEHPVVVFTHGYTGTFTDYTFLFEDLASRGYVVASIDHTYEATGVEFPDGRYFKSLVGSHLANTWRTDDQSLAFALSVRLDDLKFVVNELERLNASTGNPFAGKLDMTKVALAGHSLGGLTTWFGVRQDARFKAGILLDPYLVNVLAERTETPVMLLTMGHEQRSKDECQLWSDLLGPRFSLNLRGAEHLTPSDAVWLAKGAIQAGAMGPDKTIAAVRDYIAAFLDANLLGKPGDRLLTGPSLDYPDAVVTTPDESFCSGITGN